jgi:archaellum component FlaG (FlaF/FlaG flagellin family)
LNRKRAPIIEQLAFLSVKHCVYLAELFQALVSARETGKSVCMELTVEYRGSINNEATFLITKRDSVVIQFHVPEEFLSKKDICFENWIDTDKIRKQMSKQNLTPRLSTLIQDLRHGMKRVTVEAEVLEAPKPSRIHTYGTSAMLTKAWIADETGKIKLCLWNEQAKSVVEGDIIQIKNAAVSIFKGERLLRLGKTGTISVLQNRAAQSKILT